MQVDVNIYDDGTLVASVRVDDSGVDTLLVQPFDPRAATALILQAVSKLLGGDQPRSLDQFRGAAGPYQGPSAGDAGMA